MASALSFTERFSSFLSENVENPGSKRFLLAVSGGIDSMVMLHLFHKSELAFKVAHCNFGLRGAASDGDEDFVSRTCEQLGVTCVSKRFETLAESEYLGISIQMAARDLRYGWFQELMQEQNFDFLCTAHHRGDQAETVLFNLTKGTGIAGLHGIRALKDQFLRPLMPFNRKEIKKYARAEGIQWREDASNASNKYSRNLIRNEVIPLLKKINPSVEEAFWRSSQRISMVEEWLADQVLKWREKVEIRDGDVVMIALKPLDASKHRSLILIELLKPFGFTYTDIEQIFDPRHTRVGRQFKSNEYELVCDRDQLVITPIIAETDERLIINGPGEFAFNDQRFTVEVIDKSNWQLDQSKHVLQVDANKIEWPLVLRHWQQGDTIQPLGMKGRKKVSDILIDEKVPLNIKRRQLVLKDESDTLWTVGLRMGEKFKVHASTESICLIKAKPVS